MAHPVIDDSKTWTYFQKAVDFERAMRVKRPELFLHKTLQPLEAVDFTDDQMDMYGESCLGGCFT